MRHWINLQNKVSLLNKDVLWWFSLNFLTFLPLQPKDKLYKPNGNQLVKCSDPICAAVQPPFSTFGQKCAKPIPPCVYKVEYADNAESTGALARDYMHIGSPSGSNVPLVVFG